MVHVYNLSQTHTKQIKKKELLMQQKHSEANVRTRANIGKLTPTRSSTYKHLDATSKDEQ
jgi:septal ring factor EnvC (AmiA/AmiB activator)